MRSTAYFASTIPAGGQPARHEGSRFNVKGITFNQTEHSGFTVFIADRRKGGGSASGREPVHRDFG